MYAYKVLPAPGTKGAPPGRLNPQLRIEDLLYMASACFFVQFSYIFSRHVYGSRAKGQPPG